MNKQETFRGMPIWYWNEKKNAFVCYNQWDMGAKFKVYSIRKNDDGTTYKNYEVALHSQGEAYAYADTLGGNMSALNRSKGQYC